jgi:hypothetical protein
VSLLTCAADASDFGTRFAPGTITTREQAKAALAAAKAEEQQIEKTFKAREAECYQSILVNDCRERARREHELAKREVRRVEVDAHDVERQLDAEERARRKADEAAKSAGQDKKNQGKPGIGGDMAVPATDGARQGREISPDEAARNRAQLEERERKYQAQEAARPVKEAERASSAAEQKEKQAQAAAHAKKSEEERIKREARRAQRQKELEKKEALRESVRKKAEEEAAGAAGN